MTIKRLSTRPIYLTKDECEFTQAAIDALSSVMAPPISSTPADAVNVRFAKSTAAARLRALRILFDWPQKEIK